jgi:hypothetical protein
MLNAMTNLMAALAAYTIEPLNLSAFKLLEKQQPVIASQAKTPNWVGYTESEWSLWVILTNWHCIK